MIASEKAGKTGPQLQATEDEWLAKAGLKRFDEAVVEAINRTNKGAGAAERYLREVKGKSIREARALAREVVGEDVFFDWDAPRTREGYYRLKGGCDCAINRALAYAPYCDAIWMESKLPDYKQAEDFAAGVHAVWPDQKSVFFFLSFLFPVLSPFPPLRPFLSSFPFSHQHWTK